MRYTKGLIKVNIFMSFLIFCLGQQAGVSIHMDERLGQSVLPRHHTLPHGSTHTHPSNGTLSQTSQQMYPTPVMPVIPQQTPTALVSPTQLGHHPTLPSPSGPAPTNTYMGQVFYMCFVVEVYSYTATYIVLKT